MKKYKIIVFSNREEEFTGYLNAYETYYTITTKDNKKHYFPVQNTIIIEL